MNVSRRRVGGFICLAAFASLAITGCNAGASAPMSTNDVKNFKGGATRTAADNQKLAAGIADFYKRHPEYLKNGAQASMPGGMAAPPAANR